MFISRKMHEKIISAKEQEIKEICLKDVLEKLSNEIKIIREDK